MEKELQDAAAKVQEAVYVTGGGWEADRKRLVAQLEDEKKGRRQLQQEHATVQEAFDSESLDSSTISSL